MSQVRRVAFVGSVPASVVQKVVEASGQKVPVITVTDVKREVLAKQVELAEVVIATEKKLAPKEVPYERRLSKMSIRQLGGELKRVIRRNHLPHEIQLNEKTGAIKGVSKGALVDAAFAVILKIMLDNHSRGMSPYPR